MPAFKLDPHKPMPRDERGWRVAPARDGRGMPDSPTPKPHRSRGFLFIVLILLALNWGSLLLFRPGAPPRVTVFSKARAAAPAIIFIDELDAIGRSRRRVDRAEVRHMLDAAHSEVVELLTEHREALESLSAALIENETLDEHDAYAAAGVPQAAAAPSGAPSNLIWSSGEAPPTPTGITHA